MFKNVESLKELFEIELRYAYDCERKLLDKGLPRMIDAARSPELQAALRQHLEETRSHAARLEKVFSVAGLQAKTKDNEVIDAMISAAKDSANNIEASALRDTALIVNGNIVEHYEMALYGSLAAVARQIGLASAIGPLEETLREEKAADAKLTQLAEASTNAQAAVARGAS